MSFRDLKLSDWAMKQLNTLGKSGINFSVIIISQAIRKEPVIVMSYNIYFFVICLSTLRCIPSIGSNT